MKTIDRIRPPMKIDKFQESFMREQIFWRNQFLLRWFSSVSPFPRECSSIFSAFSQSDWSRLRNSLESSHQSCHWTATTRTIFWLSKRYLFRAYKNATRTTFPFRSPSSPHYILIQFDALYCSKPEQWIVDRVLRNEYETHPYDKRKLPSHSLADSSSTPKPMSS